MSESSIDPAFFERFTGPIDLSEGASVTVAPLRHPAALIVSSEVLLILPELETPVPELQDYKILSMGGLSRYVEEQQAIHQEFYEDFEPEVFYKTVKAIDRIYEDEYPLPRGMMILRQGEESMIGRAVTPELDLPNDVSRIHATLANCESGITFSDTNSTNGTKLFLSPVDAARELPKRPIEKYIPARLRDELYLAYAGLCNNLEGFYYTSKDGGVIVDGGLTENADNGELGIELIILQASGYPDLKPSYGYTYKSLYLDKATPGVLVTEFSSGIAGKPYVSKIPRIEQLSKLGAEQALKLTGEIKQSKEGI